MPSKNRSVLNEAGVRAYARLASGVARELDGIIELRGLKRSDVAQAAGLDKAALTRILDGTRNLELRTIAAVLSALGYVMDVKVKPVYGTSNVGSNNNVAGVKNNKNLVGFSKVQNYFTENVIIEKASPITAAMATTSYPASASTPVALPDIRIQGVQ